MSFQQINDQESGLSVRSKLNAMLSDIYNQLQLAIPDLSSFLKYADTISNSDKLNNKTESQLTSAITLAIRGASTDPETATLTALWNAVQTASVWIENQQGHAQISAVRFTQAPGPKILPAYDATQDLGSDGLRWGDAYIKETLDVLNELKILVGGSNALSLLSSELRLFANRALGLETNTEEGYIATVTSPSINAAGVYSRMLLVNGKIYITDYDSSIYVLDAATLAVEQTYVVTEGACGLTYNASLNRLYIGDYTRTLNANYIDLSTPALVNVNTGIAASRDIIKYNPFNQKIYSFDFTNVNVYDQNYTHLSTHNVIPGMNGYDICVNEINGKIYLPNHNFSDYFISIFDVNFTLLNTLSYVGWFNNIIDSTFDIDRNRVYIPVYVAGVAKIAVIDGVTDLELSVIDLALAGQVSGITYSNDVIAVSVEVSPSVRHILSIDANTHAITTVFIEASTTQGSAIYDSSDSSYYAQTNNENVKKIEYSDAKFRAVIQPPTSPVSNTTHELQPVSGIIAHLSDITPDIQLGDLLVVSSDGLTIANGAQKGNLNKHFSLLTEAINTAVSGDTIMILGGTHILSTNMAKNGVKYICLGQPIINASTSTIFADFGSQISVSMKGDAIFTNVGSNRLFMRIQHSQTKFNIECKSVTVSGSGAKCIRNSGGSEDSMLHVTDYILATGNMGSLYAIQVEYSANGTFVCPKIMLDSTTSSGTAFTVVGFNHAGKVDIIGNIYGKSESDGTQSHSVVMMDDAGNSGGILNITGDIIQQPVTSPSGFYGTTAVFVTKFGNVNIKGNIYTSGKRAIWGYYHTGKVEIEGNIYSTGSLEPIHVSHDMQVRIKNSIISSDSANDIIVINSSSTAKVYLSNVKMIQNHTDNAIVVSGIKIVTQSDIILDNVKIIMDESIGSPESITASSPKDIKILNNLMSNVDVNPNITNIISGTDFIFDTNIE